MQIYANYHSFFPYTFAEFYQLLISIQVFINYFNQFQL